MNTEAGLSEQAETDKNLPVPVPDSALTIPENRLTGSILCMNCGTELQGPFCHYCGQPDKNLMRFFPVLMRELLSDFLDFDSRFTRTLKPLLFKPGKLTRDYLDGRRFRYVPPLRLYIFSSLIFFFLAAVLAGDAIKVGDGDVDITNDKTGFTIQIDDDEEEDLREALEGLDSIEPGLADQVTETIKQAQAENESREADGEGGEDHEDGININGKPWDRETNPFIVGWLPDFVNDWINDEIEESPQKGKAIEANPDLFKDKVFDVLPATMFVLLPIVALLFKIWYLFAKKYYVEHLIFALHNHSFIFVVALIMLLLNTFAVWQDPTEQGQLTRTIDWINTMIACWIPVYMLISLKRVYQQGWPMTCAKFSLIGISYMVLLGFATAIVALLSFVLL
jgi:hypothetical protein